MLPLHGQGPFHGLAQVELEVKAIRYLHGVRRSLSRSLSILTLPIAPQYLHSRMLAQPHAEHLCGTGRQDIYHFVPLKIDEDGAERHSLLPGPIVYSQHADRRGSRMPRCLFELAQQGMPTDRHTESPQQARTGTSAQSSAHHGPGLSQELGLASVRLQDARQAFGKDPALALRGVAAPTAHPEIEGYGDAL